MSYFVVNKQLDYQRGFLEGGEFRDGRLHIRQGERTGACFISRLFDSRESGTEWARFTVEGVPDAGAGLQLSFYTSETDWISVGGVRRSISELISDPGLTSLQKKAIFDPLFKKHFIGHDDVLLYGVQGRYLFFILNLFQRENGNSCGDMCLYFPKDTWLKYLPGVYRRSAESADFTERFLGIFQSMYEDRSREIRGSAAMLNPVSCSKGLLVELAQWMDIRDIYLWPEDKLRILIRSMPELSARRGTIGGLRSYLELYTGEEPVIREDSNDPCSFMVGVSQEYLDDPREYRALLRIIGHMKPAGMKVRLEAKSRRMQAESEVKIGINSRLIAPEETEQDGTPAAETAPKSGREA